MQLTSLKKTYYTIVNFLNAPKTIRVLRVLAVVSLTSLAAQAFGEEAKDLLKGTEDTLMKTLEGTGKKYLYIGECIVSLLAYIQTKNFMVLLGIIIVAIFFNIMLTMAASVKA